LNKKGFKEARVTIMRLDDLGTFTTLASNKSQRREDRGRVLACLLSVSASST